MSSVSVAGVDLPVADEMKVLGVVLDRRLSFDRYATSVARACNFHAQAIRHIRSLLTPELSLTLACSLILSRLDYCNTVLYGAQAGSIQKLQRVQNTAARIVLQAPRRSPAQPLLEAALAASPPADLLEAGRSNKQDPCHIHTILPQRSYQTSGIYTSTP